MDTTDTTRAPAAGGRQVGQVLAGRYRLGVYKGGDDIADVWHALDESTEKVVTLEILRDRGNETARQRFLAEAQRMAAIERPSVMRVAAIHNEATDTFIVFEHLIPLPVVLTGLTAVATDGRSHAPAAPDKDKTVVITPVTPQAAAPVAPQAPAPVAPATLAAVVGPKRSAAEPEPTTTPAAAPPSIVELDETPGSPLAAQSADLSETVQAASRSLTAARSDLSRVGEWRTGLAAEARLLVGEVVRDVGMDTFAADARAFIANLRARVSRRFDATAVTSLLARVTAVAASVASVGAHVTARASQLAGAASKPRTPSVRAARVEKARPANGASTRVDAAAVAGTAVRVGAVALSSAAAVGMSLAASAAPVIGRARGNPVVLAGATAAAFLIVFVVSPLDEMVGNAFRSGPAPSATAAPSAALAPAPFEVPPLSAYGAAFDSQGAYPTTTPNGAVEWVVALRNTGSAGWYRGIEGAQAALALPDGTGVAVQSTSYVAPGQVGWFVVRFRARAEVGSYTVQLRPRIDGRGPLPDLGIFAVVTVQKNP